MFRDDLQRARVCQILLMGARMDNLWLPSGPTSAAEDYRKRLGGPLSGGETTLLSVAWDMWNGGGWVALSDVVVGVNGPPLMMIGELIVAVGMSPKAIDAWCDQWEATHAKRLALPRGRVS